jgi:hypothetical protein
MGDIARESEVVKRPIAIRLPQLLDVLLHLILAYQDKRDCVRFATLVARSLIRHCIEKFVFLSPLASHAVDVTERPRSMSFSGNIACTKKRQWQ